jgi:manganese/zinc/iron transport system substrate-binding protein
MSRSLIALLVVVCCVSCRPADTGTDPGQRTESANPSYPIGAVATVGMVADIVRQVGGEQVAVTQIMGAGVDPHLYKVSRDDVRTLLDADIVFYNGLLLEGKMTDTLISVARQKPVHAVTTLIDESRLMDAPDAPGHHDPHVWMDVSAWSQCVDAVAEALSEYDPAHAADYQTRADAYQKELEKLHQYGIDSLATVPEPQRVLITSHDAFNYFGRAYSLDVQGVQGLSTESEAGLQRVNQLVDLIVEHGVRAVFVESSVSRKNIEALVEGARSRGHEVTIGGELYSDAMGAAGTYEGTYMGMLDHNITTVTRALGGEAPAGGLNGKLSSHSEGK